MPEIYASIILALRELRRATGNATRGGNLLLSGTVPKTAIQSKKQIQNKTNSN